MSTRLLWRVSLRNYICRTITSLFSNYFSGIDESDGSGSIGESLQEKIQVQLLSLCLARLMKAKEIAKTRKEQIILAHMRKSKIKSKYAKLCEREGVASDRVHIGPKRTHEESQSASCEMKIASVGRVCQDFFMPSPKIEP